MMNRRQFVYAAAAGAAMLSRAKSVFAATYDLIIKGGRVIDPSLQIDAIRDVAIASGRIAAVEANIVADAAETIDARASSWCRVWSTFTLTPPASKTDRRCAWRTA